MCKKFWECIWNLKFYSISQHKKNIVLYPNVTNKNGKKNDLDIKGGESY